ncbi:hypothetical protein PAXRUDRAFT_830449 [Paxillus rubicundulus Ve08.2h10]|uniref:Uncharacterized protein n=1 Tax=Paxillus rubicundulus Ve08.2h10 TaxID=930991 RepID=A0A0D0DYU3_9AGAM|nr:hypothetical protein PAXRUDRAFT_830449 [Paxillus rubicundulus Ve08.2h10]
MSSSGENDLKPSLLRRSRMITPLKKARPVLKDIQNALTLQASESRRYVIVQGDPCLSCPAYPLLGREGHHTHRTPIVKQALSTDVTCTPASTLTSVRKECSGGYAGAFSRGSLRRSSSMIVSRSLDSLQTTASCTRIEQTGVNIPYATANITEFGNQSNIRSSYDDSHLVDRGALFVMGPSRSLTPPLNPPALPPSQTCTGHLLKRSGRTFALVPAEVNGKRVFTHAVANQSDVSFGGYSSPIPTSARSVGSPKEGLPEDMRDMLRQLDDLAHWVKAASSSREPISPVSTVTSTKYAARPAHHSETETGRGMDFASKRSTCKSLPDKGKGRMLYTHASPSGCSTPTEPTQLSSAQTGDPTGMTTGANRQSEEGLIYEPSHATPEFLVGSSRSPIAYPVHGYSSPPSHPPLPRFQPSSPTNNTPFHRRVYERRSAPCPPPTAPLVSPSGKASFKAFFQRSRCNTTAVSRPEVPLRHGYVEATFRRDKRMRLPWLRI